MTGTFQQQSLRRKIIYFGIIVVLFAATLVWRWSSFGVEAQAQRLSLREQHLGETELTGSTVRLMLTGSRGIVICGLWWGAEEKQKQHRWNELEQLVRSITKLQPHFITPWLYQSWNLAYNVSVESDRVKDKYFYIYRGTNLLAEGERQNKGNPDIRRHLGIFYKDKIGLSDEQNTLRCLFQMSCMKPSERAPARFRGPGTDQVQRMDEFQKFCIQHPMFVRRLRNKLRCKTPEDVVDFLASNQKIPSVFEDLSPGDTQEDRLKSPEDSYPILPPDSPDFRFGKNWQAFTDAHRGELRDVFDSFAAAQTWFCYAQDALNPDHPMSRYRPILFRGMPAISQTLLAERLEQEGWFDEQWEINDWFPKDPSQPDGPKMNLKIGDKVNWAGEAWEKAFQMTVARGNLAHLYKTPEELAEMGRDARRTYYENRRLTNFHHFYITTLVERTKEAVSARKYFYKAKMYRDLGDNLHAIELFEDPAAFGPPATWDKTKTTGWKKIFLKYPDFANDLPTQTETYKIQYRYKLLVLNKIEKLPLKELLVMGDYLGQAAQPSPGIPIWLPPTQILPNKSILTKGLVDVIASVPMQGPFDDVDAKGEPLLSSLAVSDARYQLGIIDPLPTMPAKPRTKDTRLIEY